MLADAVPSRDASRAVKRNDETDERNLISDFFLESSRHRISCLRVFVVMNLLLCSAIRSRRLVTFSYDGGRRTVEPYCHGASEVGHELLRGYQTAGYSRSGVSQGWKMFRLEELSGLAMTSEVFADTRPEYDPMREEKMATVFCRI